MGVTWIVERGNTLWKVGIFEADKLVSKISFEYFSSAELPKSTPSIIMLTGSGSWSDEEESTFYKLCGGELFVFTHGDDHPLVTQVYKPSTLGTDRVANSYAVQLGIDDYMRVNPVWLVVDVGTCITSDLIVEGVHQGGSISPGIQSRLNAMNSDTHALPAIEFKINSDKVMGETRGLSTEDAMIKGAADGVVSEIVGRWSSLKQEFPSIGIILTGGGSSNLELGPVTPKFIDSNLTLKGYYALLQSIKSF